MSKSLHRRFLSMACAIFLFTLPFATHALADGSETLGPPSIPIADGTGVIASGTGLITQPGSIALSVPVGATVEQVLLYWNGFGSNGGGNDNTIIVDGMEVTGDLIGGPDFFFINIFVNESSTFRADITDLGLIGPGPNSVSVDGLMFSQANNGAGILVIIDDGSGATTIDLRDGNDLAFIGFAAPRMTTVPQTYSFAPAGVDRIASLSMFFSSVEGVTSGGGIPRPSSIVVTIDGVEQEFNDLLGSLDGDEWDTLTVNVDIPAGASSLTVQALSEDREGTGALPASFVWNAAALFVPPPPDIKIEKFTNGYDADDADGFPVLTPPDGGFAVGGTQVPLVEIGNSITWTYVVTNNGPEPLVNVTVADSEGVTVVCPQDTLDPGETITCLAMGTGLDLDADPGATIVRGCDGRGTGMPQPTYENIGTVVGTGETSGVEVSAEDPSHYCNPPDVMLEKFTNGHDGDDPNGIPAPGPGSGDPGDMTVAEVPSGDPILWTYEVTNNGPEALDNVVVTDSRQGVDVTCPQDTLAPGETITCTATGSAEDLEMTGGDVDGCGAFGMGDTRPTYENLGSVVAQGTTSGLFVEDDDPSHYCNPEEPPECGLTVDKTCELPPPPAPPEGQCAGKLQQFTMIWDGNSSINIVVGDGLSGSSQSSVDPGDEVTFFADGSTNDTIVNISGSVVGQSTFHVSCSDDDMDGDTTTNDDQEQVSSFGRDCGKDQGNGKGSSGINDWLLEGFVDDDGAVLDCSPDPDVGATSCEFTPVEASCETLGKPSNLSFEYTGGGCPGDNDQGGKSNCSGSIDPNMPVTVTVDSGTLGAVNPGEMFIVPTTGSNTRIVLSNNGGTETNDVHTSCSAPLAAGDEYGSLTLEALDGVGNGSDVVYAYQVSNGGDATVDNISVVDDQLGPIGSIASLAPGESETLTATAFISMTTTNVASVDGDGPPGAECSADSNPVVVTVLPPPPCSASIAFKELKDDAIKWTLSNDSPGRKATMETFRLVFPAAFGAIKEVKLDGGIFKADDSDTFPNGVPSGGVIGPDDWTKNDVTKRQLDPGESRTLEVKFTEQDKDASQGDFDLTVTFEEGCMVGF